MNLLERALAIGLRALADQLERGELQPVELASAPAVKPKPAPARKPARPWHDDQQRQEQARLVAKLVKANGTLQAAGERFGFAPQLLARWRDGRAQCSPGSLTRLRQAAAEGPIERRAEKPPKARRPTAKKPRRRKRDEESEEDEPEPIVDDRPADVVRAELEADFRARGA